MNGSLAGIRVVEIGAEIAGPYCTKLFVDLGADVCKIEPPTGDSLRNWGPFSQHERNAHRSGLFEYLNAGKRGATLDLADENDSVVARRLIADAHLLVENLGPGALEGWGLDRSSLQRINPGLVIVRISGFGQDGPWRDRRTTSLTMQAAAGWVSSRQPDRPPVQAGARISEFVPGAYAALAGLTALRMAAGKGGQVIEVDVSQFECLISTLPYPMMMAERLKLLRLPTNARAAPMLGIVRARDGWIGINCLTGQHWLDVCAMLGLPEFGEHQLAIMQGGPQRDAFFTKAQLWLDERTVTDIVDVSQAMRIPAAPVCDGASILSCPQYAERGFFVEAGTEGGSFKRPGPPFRLSKTPVAPVAPAPRLGEKASLIAGSDWPDSGDASPTDPCAPFRGLKILDLSTFWAGAYLTCYMGALGADVVKVESVQRPDGHRFSGAMSRDGDDWYERGPLWQATNLNKRDITLDLSSERGRAIALKLAAAADVVVENFSPRVVEHFGLDYHALVPINPDVIMVRMPGFGLAGPWRDYVGWALNIEQLAGMSAATGYPDGPPCNLQGPADPIAGVHAGVALLAALDHRRRTGDGQLIEVAQIEVGAAVSAEPLIEYSMNGVVRGREGNRHRNIAQGVYPANVADDWVAVSIRDDADWSALAAVMSRPELLSDSRFSTTASRLDNHDEFDEIVAGWTLGRTADEVVNVLSARGIPAERVLTGDRMYEVPQLDARGYYQEIDHPITGRLRYPGWPFYISPGLRWPHRCSAPTLGQHNNEVLGQLGISDEELNELRVQQVIGEKVLNL